MKYGRSEGRQAMTRPRYRSRVFQKSTYVSLVLREFGEILTGFYDGDLAVGADDEEFVEADNADDHVDNTEKKGQVNANSKPSFDHEIRHDEPGKNEDCDG